MKITVSNIQIETRHFVVEGKATAMRRIQYYTARGFTLTTKKTLVNGAIELCFEKRSTPRVEIQP